MAKFKYATTGGAIKEFEAADQASALAASSGFADRAPTSGIQLVTTPAAVKTTTVATTPAVDRTEAASILKKTKSAQETAEDMYNRSLREANQYAASQRQARIDAINAAFAPRIAREEERGRGELAKTAALNFKKGTVGSGVDTTATGETKALNEEAMRGIEAEKALMINEAFGYYDELAKERAKQSYDIARQTQEDQTANQNAIYDKAAKSLGLFGKSGVTLDQLKTAEPNLYNDMIEIGGLTDFEISGILAENNPAIDSKIEFKDGSMYQYYVDPTTGKMVVNTQKVDLNNNEEFKSIDGIGYGVKNDANGNLVLRKLTSKSTAPRVPGKNTNYTATTIPKDIKGQLLQDIGDTQFSVDQILNEYPEVSSSYIRSEFNAARKKTTTSGRSI